MTADSTLWDAARLLSVGEEGYSYRSSVGARVAPLPEFKEISAFFTAELTAQLADARSMTTAKLDAPGQQARAPAQLRVDQARAAQRVAAGRLRPRDRRRGGAGRQGRARRDGRGEHLGPDAAARRHAGCGARPPAGPRAGRAQRVAVALKVDEAPLVLNRGFAETMALKRSAGLETVACWQADAQWTDREVREQLDALFAHRVYFATASARDARRRGRLTMAEFSDTVRPGHRAPIDARPSRRAAAPAQAPRDR